MKTHRGYGATITPSRTLTGPLVGTLDGVQKRHLRKMITSFPKKKKNHGISFSDPCVPLEGHPFGIRGGGTRPFV